MMQKVTQGPGKPPILKKKSTRTPYQFGYELAHDSPLECKKTEPDFPCQKEDIVICGSDGLWDNLFHSDIESVVTQHLQEQNGQVCPEILAQHIATMARDYVSMQPDGRDSPFGVELRSRGENWPSGRGKADDISVVVGYVYEA